MARHSVNAERAFEMLRDHSQHNGRKLSDVAAAVVESHLLLLPPRRAAPTAAGRVARSDPPGSAGLRAVRARPPAARERRGPRDLSFSPVSRTGTWNRLRCGCERRNSRRKRISCRLQPAVPRDTKPPAERVEHDQAGRSSTRFGSRFKRRGRLVRPIVDRVLDSRNPGTVDPWLSAETPLRLPTGRPVALEVVQALLAGQELERKRLARELHDETAQALTSILLGLKALEEQVGKEPLALIRRLVGSALDDVRRLAVELRPPALDDFGLEPALDHLAAIVAEQSGLGVTVSFAARGERLTVEQETALYRIVQQALTNVVNHADARSVRIVVSGSRRHRSCADRGRRRRLRPRPRTRGRSRRRRDARACPAPRRQLRDRLVTGCGYHRRRRGPHPIGGRRLRRGRAVARPRAATPASRSGERSRIVEAVDPRAEDDREARASRGHAVVEGRSPAGSGAPSGRVAVQSTSAATSWIASALVRWLSARERAPGLEVDGVAQRCDEEASLRPRAGRPAARVSAASAR